MATAVVYTQRKKARRAQTTTALGRSKITLSAPTVIRHCQHQIETCYKCQVNTVITLYNILYYMTVSIEDFRGLA